MCGILGCLHVNGNNNEASLHALASLLEVQKHRGPNFQQLVSVDSWVFGHNRLSIIDLRTCGNQPMQTEDLQYTIAFNGEIYNFKSIRKDLEALGHTFNSNTDTEVVLKGYVEWGESILQKLNGMFAFAIYNSKEKSVFAARDRFGQKPFYYTPSKLDNNEILFASELNTLIAYEPLKQTLSIDWEAINYFLSLQYIPAPNTAYQQIKALPAAHCMRIDALGQIELEPYYDIKINKSHYNLSYPEAKEVLKDTITKAVKLRTIADVELGSFLSGGIDSSIITALLAKNSTKKVHTVSVGFENKAFSELDKAATIAKKYNTKHHEYILKLADAKQGVETIIKSYGQPFGDSSAIPTYYLSKVAKENITVALSGDGGDELFTGYTRYHLDRLLAPIEKMIPATVLSGLSKQTANLVKPRKGVPIDSNYALGLKRLPEVFRLPRFASILRWGSFYSAKRKADLYKATTLDYTKNAKQPVSYLREFYERKSNIKNTTQRTQYTDFMSYTPGDYLIKTDIASMQHALEVRCPLLDVHVVELAFSLNPKHYIHKTKGKKIFKDAFAHLLTKEVLYGPKRGFGIPISSWFRGDWLILLNNYLNAENGFCNQFFNTDYIQQLIAEHQKNSDDHGKRLYLLLVLEVWYQSTFKQ